MEKGKKSYNKLNESDSLIKTAVDHGPDLEGIYEKGFYVCVCHVVLESLWFNYHYAFCLDFVIMSYWYIFSLFYSKLYQKTAEN